MTDQQTTDTDELYTTEGIIHIDDIYRNVICYNEKGDLPEAIKLAKLHLSKQQKSVYSNFSKKKY